MHISYFIFKLASRQEKLPLTSEKQITSPRSRNQRYAAKNRTTEETRWGILGNKLLKN